MNASRFTIKDDPILYYFVNVTCINVKRRSFQREKKKTSKGDILENEIMSKENAKTTKE